MVGQGPAAHLPILWRLAPHASLLHPGTAGTSRWLGPQLEPWLAAHILGSEAGRYSG